MTECKKPSDKYVSALREYGFQGRGYHAEPSSPRADATLLTNGLERWLVSVAGADVQNHTNPPLRIRIHLKNPRAEGTTERYCDPEFLYVAILHVIYGGSFYIQVNQAAQEYYWRMNIYGQDIVEDKKTRAIRKCNRQIYILRLIVDTSVGDYTKEALGFKDLTRAALGSTFSHESVNRNAKYGRKHAMNWSLSRRSERADWKIYQRAGDYRKLLSEAYEWLDRIPLGFENQPK
jgi:hypothetical protein